LKLRWWNLSRASSRNKKPFSFALPAWSCPIYCWRILCRCSSAGANVDWTCKAAVLVSLFISLEQGFLFPRPVGWAVRVV
jgi:hypothetical protein